MALIPMVISKTNDELLKLSICRYYGPMPNEIGNLCIAGHNYKNNLMFSKLNKLNINIKPKSLCKSLCRGSFYLVLNWW